MTDLATSRALLEKLVSFPTVSRESNLDLVDWAEDWLSGIGARCFRDYNADGSKASLYAHLGPDIPGGVILSGHTDVVPVDGQDWSTDPFTVVENGRQALRAGLLRHERVRRACHGGDGQGGAARPQAALADLPQPG